MPLALASETAFPAGCLGGSPAAAGGSGAAALSYTSTSQGPNGRRRRPLDQTVAAAGGQTTGIATACDLYTWLTTG
jgi:hypothetical protein